MKPKEQSPSSVSRRLRELRTVAGMTQREVAEHLGIQRSTYAYYETGAIEPSLPLLQSLAAEYRVSVGYLLGHETTASTLPLHQAAHNPLEGAELMAECTREERRFLSMLRRMNNAQVKELDEFCLNILSATLAEELSSQDFEQHIHTVEELLPAELRTKAED